MNELRYWMSDTGHVMATEECPGRLWYEITFEEYDSITHPGKYERKINARE